MVLKKKGIEMGSNTFFITSINLNCIHHGDLVLCTYIYIYIYLNAWIYIINWNWSMTLLLQYLYGNFLFLFNGVHWSTQFYFNTIYMNQPPKYLGIAIKRYTYTEQENKREYIYDACVCLFLLHTFSLEWI